MALADAQNAVASLKEQSEDYKHQITRWLRTRGVKVETLGSDVANFANPVDAIVTLIAGAKAIPKRILTGSEMGELASSQDRDNWRDQVDGRRMQYAGPYIVRPLVDRLIAYGYLPKPSAGDYEVRWPGIQTLTEAERVEGAKGWSAVNATQGDVVFTSEEIRDKWAGFAPLDDEQRAAIEDERRRRAELSAETGGAVRPAFEGRRDLQGLDEYRAAQDKPRDYSSTQVQLPQDIAEKMLEFGASIPDEDLAEDGREDSPHVTIKYGLHTDDPDDVRELLGDVGPVTLTLGKLAVFTGDGHDVLYIGVTSPDLRRLNKKIASNLETTDTYPRYIPHACIAYLKPGLGAKYVGDDRFEWLTATVDSIVFSDQESEKTTLPLGMRAAGGPGSGNFGHAGRPGEVGGSAASISIRPVFDENEKRTGEYMLFVDDEWDETYPNKRAAVEAAKEKKAAEKIRGAAEDDDIVRVLADAITSGATDVVDAVIGVKR
jgi:hypothetical protein